MADFYKIIPKHPVENLEYRAWLCEEALGSAEVRDDLRVACARDILFWINAFGWTHSQKGDEFSQAVVPFITYPFQDDAIKEIQEALGKQDVCAAKSRQMGASWMFLLVMLHDCWVNPMVTHLIVSRTADYVDKPGDPKSLFYKMVFFLDHLPGWLRPSYEKTYMHLEFLENGATVDGTATTGDIGRGDDRKAIMMDEYASFTLSDGYEAQAGSLSTTKCRLYNSTYKGPVGAFYDCSLLDIRQLRFEWFKHPVKRLGLYSSSGGQLVIEDHDFWNRATAAHINRIAPLIRFASSTGALVINEYPFILDDKPRSPWFDNEEKRTPIPSIIAEEVEMKPRGSGSPYFPADKIAELEDECRPPVCVGDLEYDSESFEPIGFREQEDGRFRLWFNPAVYDGRPWPSRFVIGADVSEGSGASESAFSVLDRSTGEKVAEYAWNRIDKISFAEYFVAVSRWFCNEDELPARKIWEHKGPGVQFADRVMQIDSTNVFMRRKKSNLGRVTDVPGWSPDKDSKKSLFSAYWVAMERRLFLNRSKIAVRQLYRYQLTPDNSLEYPRSGDAMLGGAGKDSHGDRGTADAVTWHAMGKVEDKAALKPDVPRHSMGARKLKRRREELQQSRW